jgi:hypothetical protein
MSFIEAKTRATHDLYGPVHKGLRLALSQMLLRLGAANAEDYEALLIILDQLRAQLSISAHHLAHEDAEIHPALESRAPGSTARLAQAHANHRQSIEDMEVLIVRIAQSPAAERVALMKALYLRFSLFVAEDFAHMAEEEQLILPILQSLFADDELIEIEDRIMSRVAPAEMVAYGRLMIPAATRAERISLLDAIRANAPAEAFRGIMEGAARPTLSRADYEHLCSGLGMAA